jgi:hypothetical protein
MKFLFVLLATAFILPAIAQEKIIFDKNAEKREIKSFQSLKISQGITVILHQGNEEALAISADKKEYADAVKTEVVNGELRIYIEQSMGKWWQQLRKTGVQVKAYVSYKSLKNIDASSGAHVKIDNGLNEQHIKVDLSSGALISGTINAGTLTMDASSGAKSNLNGKVQNLSLSASSGAHVNGYGLITKEGNAHASSGGKIQLTVQDKITAHASSGGGILYRGEGTASIHTSSGGKIRRAG